MGNNYNIPPDSHPSNIDTDYIHQSSDIQLKLCFTNFQNMCTKYQEFYMLLIISTISHTHVHICGRGIFILSDLHLN